MNLKLAVLGLSFAGILCSTCANADSCQEFLSLAAQADANATRDTGTGAAYQRQAAQAYRNAYNTNCTGSRGGSTGSYGSAGRAAGMNQIMNGLAGMAAVLEQKRQREEAEAHEAAMQTELQRIRQETEDAQSKAQAEQLQIQKEAEDAQRKAQVDQTAAAAKAADDRKRQSLANPFDPANTAPAGAAANPFDKGGTVADIGEYSFTKSGPCVGSACIRACAGRLSVESYDVRISRPRRIGGDITVSDSRERVVWPLHFSLDYSGSYSFVFEKISQQQFDDYLSQALDIACQYVYSGRSNSGTAQSQEMLMKWNESLNNGLRQTLPRMMLPASAGGARG